MNPSHYRVSCVFPRMFSTYSWSSLWSLLEDHRALVLSSTCFPFFICGRSSCCGLLSELPVKGLGLFQAGMPKISVCMYLLFLQKRSILQDILVTYQTDENQIRHYRPYTVIVPDTFLCKSHPLFLWLRSYRWFGIVGAPSSLVRQDDFVAHVIKLSCYQAVFVFLPPRIS